MRFNPLIPELSVSDIEKSRAFYVDTLGFIVEYERPADRFLFVSKDGCQLMLGEINGHWNTGALEYPFGRGINPEMTVTDADAMYARVFAAGIPPFKALHEARYESGGETVVQKQFLLQDPDGYLLRFTD